MLDTGVFALGVLTNQDCVDVVVGSLVACDTLARSDVGEKVECPSEGQVERDVTLADGCCEGTLERDQVAADAVNRAVWDDGLAVFELWSDIDWLPLDGYIRGVVDVLDRLRDLWTDTVSLNQRYCVLALLWYDMSGSALPSVYRWRSSLLHVHRCPSGP